MPVSLNLATIAPCPFDRQLAIAAEAGYRGVGLVAEQIERLVDGGRRLPDIAAALRQHDLAVSEVCSAEGWMDGMLAAAGRVCRLAEFLDAGCVVAPAGRAERSIAAIADGFAALCKLAARFGCRVALEPRADSAVRNLAAAWEVVEEAGQPNGGLALDTFELHLAGDLGGHRRSIPADRLFVVQMSDCLAPPGPAVTTAAQVFPGSGVAALPDLVEALRGVGYDGWWSLELHNPDYWQTDPFVVASDGWHALKRLGVR